VIDHLQELCLDEPNSMIAYWYFTFRDSGKQKVSNLLCSLIADICSNRRDTPEVLQKVYEQSNHGQQLPTTEGLLKMLRAVLEGFDDVYLAIDALDECPKDNDERSKLLDIIHRINSWESAPIHVIVTSRSEVDIQQAFADMATNLDRETWSGLEDLSVMDDEEIFADDQTLVGGGNGTASGTDDLCRPPSNSFQSIKVEGRHVQQDVEKYLRHRLQSGRFKRWRKELKSDVENVLAARALGM
jgi:hypothetical protein